MVDQLACAEGDTIRLWACTLGTTRGFTDSVLNLRYTPVLAAGNTIKCWPRGPVELEKLERQNPVYGSRSKPLREGTARRHYYQQLCCESRAG
jgi:hypothetical protein